MGKIKQEIARAWSVFKIVSNKQIKDTVSLSKSSCLKNMTKIDEELTNESDDLGARGGSLDHDPISKFQ